MINISLDAFKCYFTWQNHCLLERINRNKKYVFQFHLHWKNYSPFGCVKRAFVQIQNLSCRSFQRCLLRGRKQMDFPENWWWLRGSLNWILRCTTAAEVVLSLMLLLGMKWICLKELVVGSLRCSPHLTFGTLMFAHQRFDLVRWMCWCNILVWVLCLAVVYILFWRTKCLTLANNLSVESTNLWHTVHCFYRPEEF